MYLGLKQGENFKKNAYGAYTHSIRFQVNPPPDP